MFRFALIALAIAGVAFAQGPTGGVRPGLAIRVLTTSQKVAQSDAVIEGKVTSLEKETVELPQYPGDKNKVAFTVAVIKVESALAGAKNATHVKVAFLAQAVGGGGGRPIRPIGYAPVQLAEGQEGIFFLQKHPGSETLYAATPAAPPIEAKAESYKDDLAKVKSFAAALAEPAKALKAAKLDDRLSAAAVIVARYRRPVASGLAVEEAIPAAETDLIVKAMLEADWTAADMPAPGFDYQASGPGLAGALGLFPGNSGVLPVTAKPGESYNGLWKAAVKARLEKGDKFEIKKFVAKDKK